MGKHKLCNMASSSSSLSIWYCKQKNHRNLNSTKICIQCQKDLKLKSIADSFIEKEKKLAEQNLNYLSFLLHGSSSSSSSSSSMGQDSEDALNYSSNFNDFNDHHTHPDFDVSNLTKSEYSIIQRRKGLLSDLLEEKQIDNWHQVFKIEFLLGKNIIHRNPATPREIQTQIEKCALIVTSILNPTLIAQKPVDDFNRCIKTPLENEKRLGNVIYLENFIELFTVDDVELEAHAFFISQLENVKLYVIMEKKTFFLDYFFYWHDI